MNSEFGLVHLWSQGDLVTRGVAEAMWFNVPINFVLEQ